MNVAQAIAYAWLNDHKMRGELSTIGPLTRECLRVLADEVERLRRVIEQQQDSREAGKEA